MATLVLLTGYMGSGKTTVGQLAASALGWEFIDLDAVVATRAGKSIAAIFSEGGESAFRKSEAEALRGVLEAESSAPGRLVALGGGTLTDRANRDLARQSATVIYLDVEPEVAWQRAAGESRPLARSWEDFRRLYEERRAVYAAAADHTVKVGAKSPAAIARELSEYLRGLTEELS